MRLSSRLNASNSLNNLLELKFVLQPKQVKQGGRETVATSEHLVGNCILKKGSSAALGRSCPVSCMDDGAWIRSTSQPAFCRRWLSWWRGGCVPVAAAPNCGGRKRERGERTSGGSKVWLNLCSSAWRAHTSTHWSVTLFLFLSLPWQTDVECHVI